MFPGIDGFEWTPGHLIFLGIFYTVVAVVFLTLALAAVRAWRSYRANRAEAIRWQADFHDLPARDRACRHARTGEMRERVCELGFDCRRCETHARLLEERPPAQAPAADTEAGGVRLPLDRLYHRGHTWVRPEKDGTVTVGLDELASRLMGTPDRVRLPKAGRRISVNGTGWRMWKHGSDVRVLSPVDGEVAATGGPEAGWYLKVKPAEGRLDARHLLRPDEAAPWMRRELERVQWTLGHSLADGGVMVQNLSEAVPAEAWDAVCAGVFLQV